MIRGIQLQISSDLARILRRVSSELRYQQQRRGERQRRDEVEVIVLYKSA